MWSDEALLEQVTEDMFPLSPAQLPGPYRRRLTTKDVNHSDTLYAWETPVQVAFYDPWEQDVSGLPKMPQYSYDLDQRTPRRCACPRDCETIVHGDVLYCDFWVVHGAGVQPECECLDCCGTRGSSSKREAGAETEVLAESAGVRMKVRKGCDQVFEGQDVESVSQDFDESMEDESLEQKPRPPHRVLMVGTKHGDALVRDDEPHAASPPGHSDAASSVTGARTTMPEIGERVQGTVLRVNRKLVYFETFLGLIFLGFGIQYDPLGFLWCPFSTPFSFWEGPGP